MYILYTSASFWSFSCYYTYVELSITLLYRILAVVQVTFVHLLQWHHSHKSVMLSSQYIFVIKLIFDLRSFLSLAITARISRIERNIFLHHGRRRRFEKEKRRDSSKGIIRRRIYYYHEFKKNKKRHATRVRGREKYVHL